MRIKSNSSKIFLYLFQLTIFFGLVFGTSAGYCFADRGELADDILAELQKLNTVPGMAAAVIKDGKIIWHGETGFADVAAKKKVTQNTQFRLASVSKYVTTAILAELVEKGKLDPDKEIHTYLPSFPKKKYPFTTRQLASHTAGISHYQPMDFNLGTKHFNSVKEGLEVFKDRPLLFESGTKFQYSSFGFNLVSAVMEGAAKKDFVSMVHDFAKRVGARSHISLFPEENLVVTILSNAGWVTAIDLSSVAIADVFLIPTTSNPCKDEVLKYSGVFKEKEITGELKLSGNKNGCSGMFNADNALGDFLGNYQGTEKDNFPVRYAGSENGKRYFVLISPMGLYSFSVDEKGIYFYSPNEVIDLKII